MELENMKLSDYVNLDDDFIKKSKEHIKQLNLITKQYTEINSIDSIEERLSTLETLKVEHSAHMLAFLTVYSEVAKLRENFEFLANERKKLKSEVMKRLILEGDYKSTMAEKMVYSDPEYVYKMKMIQYIRKFLVYIHEFYEHHTKIISRSIHQSISIIKKDIEYNKNN